ncbi:MAG: hypothetical protein ABI481_13670, partial [Pyrinomonadaceae bacterium]
AMIIFLAIKLVTGRVRKAVEEWEHADPESAFILHLIERFPRLEQAREIRSLPVRFALILIPLIAILIPLGQAFMRLQKEISRQRQENVIRREVTDIWQQHFQQRSNGVLRSTIDTLTVAEKDGALDIRMRVFDDETYGAGEKSEFVNLIASRLARSPDSIRLRLTEIPTASVLTSLRKTEKESSQPSLSELHADLSQRIDGALRGIELPVGARLVGREVVTGATGKLRLNVVYLCDTNIEGDARASLIGDIRTRLDDPTTEVSLERIPTDIGYIDFVRRSSSIPVLGLLQLDFVGRVMKQSPGLSLVVSLPSSSREATSVQNERFEAVIGHLESRWQISANRISRSAESGEERTRLRVQLTGSVGTPSPQ